MSDTEARVSGLFRVLTVCFKTNKNISMARSYQKQLTQETATQFFESGGWASMPMKDRVLFQLEQDRVIMPFEVFYRELATLLNRKPTLLEIKQDRKSLIRQINRVITVE